MSGGRFDVHQHVTDQIITMLDGATSDFHLPWHGPAREMLRPINVTSRKAYRGINILILWATAAEKGYDAGLWGSYKQWTEAGAQVRKGEKAAHIVFYKSISVVHAGESSEHDEPDRRLFARATPVFAAEQVDGWTPAPINVQSSPIMTPIEQAEAFVAHTRASITHGGNRAFYGPSTDSIHLPHREDFIGTPTSSATESYYATLLHELTHWTSHKSRCDRQLGKRFGDDAYAMEELIAELGAAFLCAELHIASAPRPDHAHYLANWLTVLRQDKRAVFAAASKASQASAFLTALSPDHTQSSV